jgi:hypothetical protein
LRTELLAVVRLPDSNARFGDLEITRFGDLFFGGLVMDELDFVSWKIAQWVLWAGPLGVFSFLFLLALGSFCAGCEMMRRKAKRDKPMGAQKLDHIKYDILPDGTLGPGDNRGLEGPE